MAVRIFRSAPLLAFLAALLGLHADIAWSATPAAPTAKSPPLRLAAGEVLRLASLACPGDEPDRIDHIEPTAFTAPGRQQVTVRCRPHGAEARLLTARQSICSRERGRWQCAPARDVLLMQLRDGSTLAVAPEGLAAEMAVHAVLEASQTTVPPFHKPALWMLRGTCTVRQAPVADFRNATEFAMACNGGTIYLTRHCPQPDKCRYFVTRSE